MRKLILSAMVIAMITSMVSCKEKTPDNPTKKTYPTQTFDTRTFDKWVYFSFELGEEVEITDFKNSMDWDIAFHRFDVRLNCGTSGIGKGGSISMGKVKFDEITLAPSEGYSLNDSIAIVYESGNWTNKMNVPGDTIIAKWLYFTGPPPQYNITNEKYVIKTADGKYAKIWLKDYYNDNSETGHVSMQYFYQKDGSKNLQP